MLTFITENFLLSNKTAQTLFFNYSEELPIIDYHNHLNPEDILTDKKASLADLWLSGDHYKWRAMRANGINESRITGDAADYDKFLAWAQTVPNLIGNPLYHWTHMELRRYFDINDLLNEKSAAAIWEQANQKIKKGELSVRTILTKENVEFVGTTDDPTDSLTAHEKLAQENLTFNVAPSFRPDKGVHIELESFIPWLKTLSQVCERTIESYDDFLENLHTRVNYFHQRGCRSSDHSLSVITYEEATKAELQAIFNKRLDGKSLTPKEIAQFKTSTLKFLGAMYADKGWAMQLHLGPLRNNNTRMFELIGPDTGFDSMGDKEIARPLSKFLDSLEKTNELPKTILYSVNPKDYYVLATMAGNFSSHETRGKVQFGTAWWFNDQIDGMEYQMKVLANVGLISTFIGMLTDSRSFLSFPRHDYFRRILCNVIGTWVEEGKAPKDFDLLGTYVKNISYYNAKNYFNL
ncbi:glucuronate isomerase [Shouchella sp. 1P09AA]|uniref:glucuronate isomerase n=1 Tax=unclassified Shouchella TaxID=2893065 RepID=UPI0039A03FAA